MGGRRDVKQLISRTRRKKLALMENLHATWSNPRSISNFTPSRFPIGCTAFLSRLSGGRFLVRQSGRLVSSRLSVASFFFLLFLHWFPPLSRYLPRPALCAVSVGADAPPLAFLFILVQAVTSRSPLPPPPASPSDGAVFVQARAAQRLVARAGQCGALGGRVSLYPHLWHGLRLSVVSTPYLRPPSPQTLPLHPPPAAGTALRHFCQTRVRRYNSGMWKVVRQP